MSPRGPRGAKFCFMGVTSRAFSAIYFSRFYLARSGVDCSVAFPTFSRQFAQDWRQGSAKAEGGEAPRSELCLVFCAFAFYSARRLYNLLTRCGGFISYRLCRRHPELDALISDHLDAFGLHLGCPGCPCGSIFEVFGSFVSLPEGLRCHFVSFEVLG